MPVTGLDTLSRRPDAVLVTTRDSRVRLYQGTSKQVVKYKGHRNKLSRISATFSPDGVYVICGSDDGGAQHCCQHMRKHALASLREYPVSLPRTVGQGSASCAPVSQATPIIEAVCSSVHLAHGQRGIGVLAAPAGQLHAEQGPHQECSI